MNDYAPLTWEPKVCDECGKRVTRKNAFYCFNLGQKPYALHHACADARAEDDPDAQLMEMEC